MKLREFKNALLVAMLRHQRKIGFNRYFEPKKAAADAGLEYDQGQIRLAVRGLHEQGLTTTSFTSGGDEDGGLNSILTASGVETAEDIEDQVAGLLKTYPSPTNSDVPDKEIAEQQNINFSDDGRYLAASEIADHIEEFSEKLNRLQAAVEQNRQNDFTDKEGRLAELAALELLLTQPMISLPLVEKILKETVQYLAQQFAEQAVGMAASALLAAALTLKFLK